MSRLHDQIGRVLGGRYRLIAPVGTGASALVFLADDTRLRRRVAVKVLHQALSEDETFLRRFRGEAQAAAALNHPNILAVYDWGEDEHEPFLVTEYLGGGSLRAMLDKGTPLSLSQALMIGLEAARALDYAHKRGFVHRDIKPANLLFGEDARLRIADFGLARALAEAAWTEPAGAVVGTARYACPEQARGEPVDGKGDVYSLALVLIEAVTGTVPFAGDTTISTLMARLDKPVEVPEALGPLRGILTRAGNPDPTQRPDAGELAVGLLAAAEHLPRPAPLPLAGATASVGDVSVTEGDHTQLAPAATATAMPTVPVDATATAVVPSPPPPVVPPDVAAAAASELPGNQIKSRRAQRKAELRAGVRKRKWTKVLLAVLVVLALLVGGLLTFETLHVVKHSVPDFTTMTKDQATAAARADHWKVNTKDTRVDGTNANQVVDQDVKSGTKLAEGKTITLTVSLGNTLKDVPIDQLASVDIPTATQILTQAGLVLGTQTEQYNETVAKGLIISVDRDTQPQLPKDSAVNVLVSKGPTPRTIPDVTQGMTLDQAIAALAGVQLGAVKVEVFSDTIPAGQVVGFDPASGTQIDRGTNVNVQISKGPHTIPDVSKQSVSDATEALQAAGYTVAGVQGNPSRTVTGTNPPAGTQAKAGTAVTIITK